MVRKKSRGPGTCHPPLRAEAVSPLQQTRTMYSEKYPSKLLQEAVESIGSLPGVGRRSALKLALHLLRQPAENVRHFTASIDRLRNDVKYCSVCRMISDGDICGICADNKRDHKTICVVESVRDVMSIEKTRQYTGVYHVLGGIISPIDGTGPSDLTIDALVSRVTSLAASVPPEDIEVIFALSGEVEGETTAFYIYRQLAPSGVKVSTLARGLGFGDDLDYADELTLGRSLLNRQLFRP